MPMLGAPRPVVPSAYSASVSCFSSETRSVTRRSQSWSIGRPPLMLSIRSAIPASVTSGRRADDDLLHHRLHRRR